LKKHNNSGKKSEPTSKPTKSRGPVQRDTKEVLAELVGKLKEKLDPKKVAATSAGEKLQSGELRPNLDRLTVGVDLGDQWSHYCILGVEGERLAEGQLRTTQQHITELFQALNAARVVFEVGTFRPAAGRKRALYPGAVRSGHGLTTVWAAAALRAGWEECEEESGGSGGAEARRLTALPLGEWRSI
jgi:hypothetical protein